MADVLILSDDPAVAGPLGAELSSAGVLVRAVGSVQELLATLRERHARAIVADLDLFPEPPWDLLEALKLAAGASTAVLAVASRHFGSRDVVTALRRGATEFTAKPLEARVAAARLQALLRALDRRRRDDPVLRVSYLDAALELDPRAHRCRVTANGAVQEVTLTPMEFSLLGLLVASPAKMLSKEEIIGALWPNSPPDGHAGTLAHFITRLRRKLGPLGAAIETVWGIGYRFDRRVS